MIAVTGLIGVHEMHGLVICLHYMCGRWIDYEFNINIAIKTAW